MKILLYLVLSLFACQTVIADSEGGPFSYTVISADRQHIFVNLVPFDAAAGFVERGVTYHQSGMYVNDGSTDPLWTVDWNARVYLPNGGRYVVRRGTWARFSGTYTEEALSFFDRGDLLKAYSARDLAAFPWLLPHSVSHYKWEDNCFNSAERDVVVKLGGYEYPNNESVSFAADETLMVAATSLGDRLTFDLTTGNIISVSHPARTLTTAILALMLLAYFVYRYRSSTYARQAGILRPINLWIGLVLTVSAILVPAVAVRYTGQAAWDCSNYLPTLSQHLHITFFLFPAWLAGMLGVAVGPSVTLQPNSWAILIPCGVAWASFWLLFSFLDGCVVAIMSRPASPTERGA